MIIDLSYPVAQGMKKYPSDPDPEIDITKAVMKETPDRDNAAENSYGHCGWNQVFKSGYTTLTIRNHHGTHVDAPAHKLPDGKTIDQYGLDRFVDLSTKVYRLPQRTREIRKEHIDIDWNDLKLKRAAALVFHTGFLDNPEEADEKEFPYFTEAAAAYVAENAPQLSIVGLDSFSFDPSGSNSEAHRQFFNQDILLLETIVNLDKVKNWFVMECLPILYKGADAAQCRPYARCRD